MRKLVLLFLLAWSSITAFAVAKPEKQTLTSQGTARTYYTFVPEKLAAPAPLLLLLHGSGRDGISQIDEWKPLAEKEAEKTLDEAKIPRSPAPGKPDTPAKTPQLFAQPDDLLAQGWLSDAGSDQAKKAERQPPKGRDIIALAPPPRENLLSLPGPLGTPDYLPDVQQGNLTFLNTKAHRFAPFVRRVALRVFQHLLIHQRNNLRLDDVVAAREMVTIEAKLDTKGNLKGLAIQSRSGSYSIDESLLKACEQGAWDENPPEEAKAEDGYIHFIFRSDINAQYDQLGLRAIITMLQVGLV